MQRLLLTVAALCVLATASLGQIIVDSYDDDSLPGDCELREAIINANNDDQSGSADCAAGSGTDTINLTGLSGDIVLTSSLPIITDNVQILGSGAANLTVDANRAGRVFRIDAGVEATILNMTITGGEASSGAGVYNNGSLSIFNCIITDNIGSYGIGIYNDGGVTPGPGYGQLTVSASVISNNHEPVDTNGNGGGINNQRGTVNVLGSTITGNQSYVGGAIINWDQLVVTNSTISGNTAENSAAGISLSIPTEDVWSLIMSHSTVVNNHSPGLGNGIHISSNPATDTAKVSLYSSIIADNTYDIYGPVHETLGYNILGNNALSTGLVDGVDGDQVGTIGTPLDPQLFSLGPFGNFGDVHIPMATSPAIDKGSCSLGSNFNDQRGAGRPVDLDDGTYPNADDGCDIGAIETLTFDLQTGVDFVGKVLLEGAYDGAGGQTANINGELPLSQPYSDAFYDDTPLDYDSADAVVSMPSGIVDWLLVSLRTGIGPETTVPESVRPAFLTQKGYIVGLDEDTLRFDNVPRFSYYVVVRHRNHLGVMTTNPVYPLEDGFGEWDFTSGIGQAYSSGASPMAQVDVSGVYAMFAGNGEPDEFITAPDFNAWFSATTTGLTGYQPADYNLDGNVTATDFNFWSANTTLGASSQVPE